MTREEIFQMEAGIELDALIAVKILGFPVIDFKKANCPYCGDDMRYCGARSWCSMCHEWRYSPYKDYSDEIADAWEVVEKIHELISDDFEKLHDGVNYLTLCYTGSDWAATFGCLYEDDQWFEPDSEWELVAHADTASLAICRAALLATLENVT